MKFGERKPITNEELLAQEESGVSSAFEFTDENGENIFSRASANTLNI